MINRLALIIQRGLMLISCIGCLICIFTLPANSPWRIGFMVSLILASVWHIYLSKCPHCGRFGGIKAKPFAKDAGKCIHCNELVEYQ